MTGTVGGSGSGKFSITGVASPMRLDATGATYVQSSGYGAVGEISATVTSGGVQYTGSSANIVTSTLGTLSAVTTNPGSPVKAGASVTVEDFIQTGVGIQQQGVPITINLCTSPCATTAGYDGKFANGASSITLTTNNTATTGQAGGVQALMPVNTTSGSVAFFNATAADPTNLASTNTLNAAASPGITTSPGSIATLVVNIAAGTGNTAGPNIKYVVNGSTAYISVAYADAYGNLILSGSAPTNQIQIGLIASAGALSTTIVYIPANGLSTNSTSPLGFGAILWTLPSTVGTTATLTASANVNGKAVQGTGSVTTVSAYPSLNVTSPKVVSGTLYSPSSFVTFQGIANATSGSASTTIATIGYKVGTGGWLSVSTASSHNLVWTVPIVLANGLNTVMFNVTDSAGKTTDTPAYTVLVDTSVPIFGAIKLVANTSSANVNVTSAEGDLNATSVTATANGTAIAASQISVTGTNNPGSSVTYLVTVSGLSAGTWSLAVSAKTLAGLSGSATGTVTVTVTGPPPAQTFTITGLASGSTPVGKGVNTTLTNQGTSSYTAYVYLVVKNSTGSTVYIGVANFGTIAPGGKVTLAVPYVLSPGSYTATAYAFTPTGAPVATQESLSFTV